MQVEKYYDESGNVAVLISPGFGAGWSTWNPQYPELLFDKHIVEFVLSNQQEKITEEWLGSLGYHDIYFSSQPLSVVWVAFATKFAINEYDGSESLVTEFDLPFVA